MNNSTYHTIIIGGGIAGLSSAVLLAKAGKKVAIYERSQHWGGRGLSHKNHGFSFNLGPHALYRNNPAHKLLQKLDIDLKGKLPVLNHHAKALVKDNVYGYIATPRAIMATKMLTAGEKLQLSQAFIKLFLAKTKTLRHTTWQTWLNDNVANPNIRAQLEASSRLTTYNNDPATASAGSTIDQIKAGVTTNVLYLDNGWQQIIDALLALAKANGVALFLGNGATAIKQLGSTVEVEVGKNGERVSAENLIIATPPTAATKLLPDSQYLQSAIGSLHSMQAACLTLALDQLPNPDCTLTLGIDQSFYYSLHSASAKITPDGKHLAYLASYLSPTHKSDAKADRAILEANFDKVQPGWREHLIHAEYLPASPSHMERPPLSRLGQIHNCPIAPIFTLQATGWAKSTGWQMHR